MTGSTNSHTARTEDYKTTGESFFRLFDEFENCLRQALASASRIPDENNASGRLRIRVDELTEVLVLGQQNSFVPKSKIHHKRVV